MIKQRKQKVEKRMTLEQQELVEKHLRLVYWVARRYRSTRAVQDLGMEEAIASGMVGLCKAATRYDPDRGIKFCTYAVYWIRSSIQEAAPTSMVIRNPHESYRSSQGGLKERIVAHPQGCNEVDMTHLIEVPSHERMVDTRIDVDTYLQCLPEKQRRMLLGVYQPNSTRRILAQQIGCTYQNIDRVVKESIQNIRYRHSIKPGQEDR
jgi:RNA polymerase sigma factor (sigma-70 family)